MLEGIVIGAGDRGAGAYVPYLLRHPEAGRIVGVAEPDPARRRAFARRYALAESACFPDHRGILDGPRRADFALIATGDALHVEPALMALERGYHVLLEKPMATSEADCRRLVEAAERAGRVLQVCHVLRYAPFFQALMAGLRAGRIGDVVSIRHSENVSYWHYAHSYCRGHWRNAEATSPLILAKSCHDLDLIHWIAGADPSQLTSLARPTELHAGNRPEGAPDFCVEGCPHASTCPYDAAPIYLTSRPLALDIAKTRGAGTRIALLRRLSSVRERLVARDLPVVSERLRWRGWPVSAITNDTSRAGVERALRTTRYGRCVYAVGDNDQVSAQTVDIRFDNGVLASFSLHGHSHREGREIRIDGTTGSVTGRFHLLEQGLSWHDHKSGRTVRERVRGEASGHGGGDFRLFAGFLDAVRGAGEPLTSARQSLVSHLMAFAADRARREGVIMELDAGRFRPAGEAADPEPNRASV